jgi:translation elongation factor P/translation initiation factor 5A
MDYLYNDGEMWNFMDPVSLSKSLLTKLQWAMLQNG